MKTLKLAILGTVLSGAPCIAAAEPVTIEVAAWKGNASEPAGLPELIAKFEREHPEIKVKLTYVSRNDIDTAVSPRFRGDNPPDVVMADMALARQWGKADLLANLDRGAWFGRLAPALRDALAQGEETHVYPLEVIGIGNFVNMGLLKTAGIDKAPETIDELKAACTTLSAAGIKPMIMAPGFPASVFAIGAGLQSKDAPAKDYGNGTKTFESSDAFKQTLQIIRDLEVSGCFDGKQQAGVDAWSTGLQEFKAGNFAMMPQGAWNIADFSKVKGLDFVFTPLPAVNKPGVALDLFGFGWAVSKKTGHQKQALAWVDFFKKDENLNILLKAESAGSPYEGGTNGTPALAASYEAARVSGGLIWYPVGLGTWPSALEREVFSTMAGFLGDPDMTSDDLLSRWDEVVEDQ